MAMTQDHQVGLYVPLEAEDQGRVSPWGEAPKRLQEIHEWEIESQSQDYSSDEAYWDDSSELLKEESEEESQDNSMDNELYGIEVEEARECQRLARKLLAEAQEKLQLIAQELRMHRKEMP